MSAQQSPAPSAIPSPAILAQDRADDAAVAAYVAACMTANVGRAAA